MEKICTVISEPEERVFNSQGRDGQPRQSTILDVMLSDGLNTYLASVFDVTKAGFPAKGQKVAVDLSFSVRKSDKDGVTRWFQSINIIRFANIQ